MPRDWRERAKASKPYSVPLENCFPNDRFRVLGGKITRSIKNILLSSPYFYLIILWEISWRAFLKSVYNFYHSPLIYQYSNFISIGSDILFGVLFLVNSLWRLLIADHRPSILFILEALDCPELQIDSLSASLWQFYS